MSAKTCTRDDFRALELAITRAHPCTSWPAWERLAAFYRCTPYQTRRLMLIWAGRREVTR